MCLVAHIFTALRLFQHSADLYVTLIHVSLILHMWSITIDLDFQCWIAVKVSGEWASNYAVAWSLCLLELFIYYY